ncbi:MAG: hypothetical protein WAK04_07980 [Xanthobacteraceae bacterium]
MLCYQQQDDFLLSMTLRTLDYRKIPSRFLEPQCRTYRRPANNRRISGRASGAGRRSAAKLLAKDEALRIAANVAKLADLVAVSVRSELIVLRGERPKVRKMNHYDRSDQQADRTE